MTPLDNEGGLRQTAEKAFAAERHRMVCPGCFASGSLSLSSSKKKRRFQCRCNKSWSCSALIDEVIGRQAEIASTAQRRPAPKRRADAMQPASSSASEAEEGPESDMDDSTADNRALRLENAALKQIVQALSNQVKQLQLAMNQLLAASSAPASSSASPASSSASPSAASSSASSVASDLGASAPSAAAAVARPATLAQKISQTLSKSKLPDRDKADFAAALRGIRNIKSRATGSVSLVDMKHRLRRVYVSGISFMRLGELKKHLYDLRFKLSKILHLDYVSKNTVEFLVYEDYAEALKKHVRFVCLSVVHLPDPSAPMDPNPSEAIRAAVRKAFLDRLARRSDPALSERPSVQAFYADWLSTMPQVADQVSLSPPASHADPEDEEPTTPC